jgi:cytochrome c oxidase cbb3-type subunit 4
MVSGIVTALLIVLFVMGWWWAWSPKRKAAFDAAARLPLDDDAESGALPAARTQGKEAQS